MISFALLTLKTMNPYLVIIFRSVAVYLFIVLAIRLFGKERAGAAFCV